MRPSIPAAFVMLVIVGAIGRPESGRAVSSQTRQFTVRFIGNASVEITDGSVTLVTDFPYQSGYSHYMTYKASNVRPRGTVISLITHGHPDHFDPRLTASRDWLYVAPGDALASIPRVRSLAPEAASEVYGVRIEAQRTPHADVEHFSYLVTWHGRSFYFPGDTESIDHVVAARGVDMMFLTPWLWRALQGRGAVPDARQLVIYHHEADEKVACKPCWIPRQTEQRTLPFG